ncbi:MAG: cupin domain-containing protein [Stackebrandtia sp.]
MTVFPASEATVHTFGASRFSSFVAPSRGGGELCAWRLDVPARTRNAVHRVSREEVLLVLEGALELIRDGESLRAEAGDAIVIAPGVDVAVDNPDDRPAAAWVTTSAGFEGTLSDGTVFVPEWVK